MNAVTTIMGSVVPILAAVGVIAHLGWMGVRRGWEAMAGLNEMQQALPPLKTRWKAEHETYLDTRQRVEDAQRRLDALDKTAHHIHREIDRINKAPPCFLHTLGAPGPNHQPFRAEVSYDAAVAASQRAAGRPVNPVWRLDNRLLIHAPDIATARREAERMFPQKGGYTTHFHASPGA